MSTVKANTVLPSEVTHDITLGASGDTTTVAADDLRVNTVKDKGGNTLWTSDGSGNLSSVNDSLKGNLILLSSQTVTNQAAVEFKTGIDSTYDIYIFKFSEINAATDEASFRIEGSTNAGVGYGVTKTTTWFYALHTESDSSALLSYSAGLDVANATTPQIIASTLGDDADACAVGELHLFNPSSTTYVKHFYSTTNNYRSDDETQEAFISGYFDTTSAINAVQFTMSSGNFDGTISMYGLL